MANSQLCINLCSFLKKIISQKNFAYLLKTETLVLSMRTAACFCKADLYSQRCCVTHVRELCKDNSRNVGACRLRNKIICSLGPHWNLQTTAKTLLITARISWQATTGNIDYRLNKKRNS